MSINMENLPNHNTGPSYQGLDNKLAIQSKQNHKGKSKQAKKSANNPAVAPSVEANANDSQEQLSVISALQEFVQGSNAHRMPSRHSVLQWRFEETPTQTVQFQATVIFVLEGVPHQAIGDWQTSKREAKRDAAERALGLFVSRWGGRLLEAEHGETDTNAYIEDVGTASPHGDIEALEKFCRQFETVPHFTHSWEGTSCTGFVDITVFGVPHTFAGGACRDEEEASSDVARRVLWYLDCPAFADAFDVDIKALVSRLDGITAPPPCWEAWSGA